MKTIIATTAIALSLTAPAFAETSAQAFFALGNDSAAERIVGETSTGDADAALAKFVTSKDSAAERNHVTIGGNEVSRDVQILLSLGNSSAAEILK